MKKSVIILFLIISIASEAQINLHSYQNVNSFNAALTGIDSVNQVSIDYSEYKSSLRSHYFDILGNYHFRDSRYGLSGYFKAFDYFTELSNLKFIRPTSAYIAINSTYKLGIFKHEFVYKPAIEIGLSSYSVIGNVANSSGTDLKYVLLYHDERFRFSLSSVIFNDNLIFGINYQGINRPQYKVMTDTMPEGYYIIGRTCSNLLGFAAFDRNINKNSDLVYFFISADRFPYGCDVFDHYWSIRRVGISFSQSRILTAASFGILNNNALFKEYKFDFNYSFWKCSLGLKYIYCDDPKSISNIIWNSKDRRFPLTNASVISLSIKYFFNNIEDKRNWTSKLVF
jgi:hypothetical protein